MTDRRSFLWISDLEGEQIDTIRSSSALEFSIDDRLDQSEILRLTIPADHAKAYLLEPDREIRWGERRFTIAEVEDERTGSQVTRTVEAVATWYELGRTVVPETFLLDDVTPAAGLATILDGTGWNVGGPTTPDTTTFSLEMDDRTPLEILRAWAKITGTFLRFEPSGRNVNLLATSGADLGLGFRYRRNVRNVRRRERPPAITRLYAIGADDLALPSGGYVEDLSYYTGKGVDLDAVGPDGRTNRDRLTRSTLLVDTSFVDQADLLAWATSKIAELAQPIVSYELDVVDLSELTGIAEKVRVGDTVRTYDPAFSTDVRTTVVRYLQHPDDPKRNRVELAYLPAAIDDPSQSIGRGAGGESWEQFVGPVGANFVIRNDATWTVARVPLRFREGGRYRMQLDVSMTGVGNGVATIEIYDGENDVVVRSWDMPYSDGVTDRLLASFAVENIPSGSRDYRLRVTVAGDGGPDPANGVDMTVEDADAAEPVSWSYLVQRAVREAPPIAPNSQTWQFEIDTFTVPDNVTEINIVCKGGGSGVLPGNSARDCANGGSVTALGFSVTPGEVLTVAADRNGGGSSGGPGNSTNGKGGGLSAVIRGDYSADITAAPSADVLCCAAGGGGNGAGDDSVGGIGGFFEGVDGGGGFGGTRGGEAATQFAGGAVQSPGGFLQGGTHSTTSTFQDLPGGGGGGFYGGGSGLGYFGAFSGAGGGGGGSGIVQGGVVDIITDGTETGQGTVTISWEDPDPV